jgi:UDP-N-acetylmuramyl pentapeptide phosphotransferase/UDP-N-acetylglucosamine-1-phosphate transferase
MNMYWVYDLPNWLFGILTIAVTVAIGLAGLYGTRKWVQRVHSDRHSHNEVVTAYLGGICVFYGITLGLFAVATWQNYTDVKHGLAGKRRRLGHCTGT